MVFFKPKRCAAPVNVCVLPFVRAWLVATYSSPRYRNESVLSGSFSSPFVESLNIRFFAEKPSDEKRPLSCETELVSNSHLVYYLATLVYSW